MFAYFYDDLNTTDYAVFRIFNKHALIKIWYIRANEVPFIIRLWLILHSKSILWPKTFWFIWYSLKRIYLL